MAKKREITISKFNVTDAGCELKAKATFSLKMFEGDGAQEHVANFDLSITKERLVALAMNTVVIDLQKHCRTLEQHSKVRELTKNVLGMKDVYPGRETVTHVREMSLEDIEKKALSDPEYRKALIARLERVQDVVDGNGK